MFGFIKKLTVAGGLTTLVRSPLGRQVLPRAKSLAADPRTRRNATELLHRARPGAQ